MHIMLVRYELHLPGVHSLKEKRSILKRLLNAIRRDYNVSAAEVDHLDAWQSSVLAIVAVGGLRDSVERIEREIDTLLENDPDVQVAVADREWL